MVFQLTRRAERVAQETRKIAVRLFGSTLNNVRGHRQRRTIQLAAQRLMRSVANFGSDAVCV